MSEPWRTPTAIKASDAPASKTGDARARATILGWAMRKDQEACSSCILSRSLQAASPLEISRDFRYGANFFLALKTRHWTVPMGICLAAAIS